MARSDDVKTTVKISSNDLASLQRGELPRPGLLLLVYEGDRLRSVALPADQPIVLGRDPTMAGGVAIDDESLSRNHARFAVRGEVVVVEDLRSKNGVWCLGEKVERAELVAGDEVRLGRVPVVVHGGKAHHDAGRPLRHDIFRVALEDEVRRAAFYHRPLALLMARAERGADSHVSRFHQRVSAALRPVDRLAVYSHDTLEILLVETGVEEATAWAKRVAASLNRGAPALLVGVATYPEAAGDAETLVEKCRDVLPEATRGERVRVVPRASGPVEVTSSADCVMSASFRGLFETIRPLASSSLAMLVLGESGVGKEVLARRIHAESPRRGQPFVIVNCAAIPETLIEATLFGYKRGAFTGALQDTPGLFEAANSGTLMLDEVGDLSKSAQAALLRVLESGLVRRVGATSEIGVDVRIIAATHRDLDAMVEEERFRHDLLHRLRGECAVVPPLRDRRDEIRALCESFIAQANRANDKVVTGIAEDAAALLEAYPWPGNVRELRNVILRAVVLCQSGAIRVEHLPERLRAGSAPHAQRTAPPPPATPTVGSAPPPAAHEGVTAPGDVPPGPLRPRMKEFETALILSAFQATSGDRPAAAKLLDLPLRTLVHRMTVLGITRAKEYQSTGASTPKKGSGGRRRG